MSATGKDGLNATVVQQMPYFIEQGLPGAESLFTGTINMTIAPRQFRLKDPHYTMTFTWHPRVTETFQLVPVDIRFESRSYSGYIYYPLPSDIQTKERGVIELLAPKIEGIVYGRDIEISVPEEHIDVFENPRE